MRTLMFVLIFYVLTSIFYSCDKDIIVTLSTFQELDMANYFDSEIFAQNDLKIYGKWKIFDISGGIHGDGYALNFDYLEIKKYGIYGFVKNDYLLEYG